MYLIKQYAGVLIGIVIGSTVGTLTTYAICADAAVIAEILQVTDCITAQQ